MARRVVIELPQQPFTCRRAKGFFQGRIAISGEMPDLAFNKVAEGLSVTPRDAGASVTLNPFLSTQSRRTAIPGCID